MWKWFVVAEMKMVLPRMLCDILENREYVDAITNALVVSASAAYSLSGYEAGKRKGYLKVTLLTLYKLKHKVFEVGPKNTIISQLENRMLWYKNFNILVLVYNFNSDVSSLNQNCKFYLMSSWNKQNRGSLFFFTFDDYHYARWMCIFLTWK